MSMLGDGEAAPREDRRAPLRPVPDDVVTIAEALGVDAAELATTRERTRAGWWIPSQSASIPPSERPHTCARSTPAAPG